MASYTFGKEEKLKSRKMVEQLFAEGKSIAVAPLRLIYFQPSIPLDFPVKAGVSASSRNFKHASDRNRIKRLLREAYRLNKYDLLQHITSTNQQLAAFFIYTGKSLPEPGVINEKMQVLLNKLILATSEAAPENT